MSATTAQVYGKLVPGQLLQLTGNSKPTIVTPLCNEAGLNLLIRTYKGEGYLPYFTHAAKAARATLVDELRDAGVEVPEGAEASHLEDVCGVRCHDEASCRHVIHEDITETVYEEDKNDARVIVACDPIQTKLRDDCMECFPRLDKVRKQEELVVRVHLFYPSSMPCMSIQDRRARLVTHKHFVRKNARTSQGYHTFHYAKRDNYSAPTPDYESMFPYTTKAEESSGFTMGCKCIAITVETVFVRDPARQQRPLYAEDAEQARVYFSYVRPSAFVTDDELTDHFPLESLDTATMPAFADDREVEKYNVLVRLYLLAHDQEWTTTRSYGCPHPLGGPVDLPVLYHSSATEVVVPDRHSRNSPVLLQQCLLPDVESQITRFCFRRVVSEVLRQRVLAAAADTPERYVAIVCYMPHGDRVPVFTDEQVRVMARLYPHLGIRSPANRREWACLSRTLYQHGISLFDILAAVGCPLRDAQGAVIDTGAYVPYTADMADDYFLVIANRPLRDYICFTNQRWVHEQLRFPDHRPPIGARAFAAWVRYWNTMAQLKQELEEQASVDTVSAHLGLGLPGSTMVQRAACLVNGRVTDAEGGLIFPELGGRRFRDRVYASALLPGTPMLYTFWIDRKLCFSCVCAPIRFIRGLPSDETVRELPEKNVIQVVGVPPSRGGGAQWGGRGDRQGASVAIHAGSMGVPRARHMKPLFSLPTRGIHAHGDPMASVHGFGSGGGPGWKPALQAPDGPKKQHPPPHMEVHSAPMHHHRHRGDGPPGVWRQPLWHHQHQQGPTQGKGGYETIANPHGSQQQHREREQESSTRSRAVGSAPHQHYRSHNDPSMYRTETLAYDQYSDNRGGPKRGAASR
nr:unnamed protein product [Leishmania braziliensis]